MLDKEKKVALITGGARRIGAAIARVLHGQGINVVVHCRRSSIDGGSLVEALNRTRADSAALVIGDLLNPDCVNETAAQATRRWGRLDVLVNNASSFYPTPLEKVDAGNWNDIVGTNYLAPLFLTKAAMPALREAGGCIVNMLDVHALRPLGDHCVYESAKAALAMLTKTLAVDLAPRVRVNGVAPGNILWSDDHPHSPELMERLFSRIPMKRMGTPEDIAEAVAFLVSERAGYITGQILCVDGGYLLT